MTDVPAACWRSIDGAGPPVVVVHGTMDRSSSFGRVTRHLDDVTVVAYDRRGYGRSADLGPPESFSQQVDDLVDVVSAARAARGGPVTVFGHSYGGTIALGAAARDDHPIDALLVYECPLPWMPWWSSASAGAAAVADSPTPEDAAELFMRRTLGDGRWERLPPSTRLDRRREGPAFVAELGQVRPPHTPELDLARVRARTIAAHGALGRDHHATAAKTVAADVTGAELIVLEGAAHNAHLTHGAELAAIIARLAEVVGRG